MSEMIKRCNGFLNRSLHKFNFTRVIKFDKLLSGRHRIILRVEAFRQVDASLRITNFTLDGADEKFLLLMFSFVERVTREITSTIRQRSEL